MTELEKLESEINRLNDMLRRTGYGQGQIDAYAAVCEERDALLEACEALLGFPGKTTPYTDAGMWEWKGELVDVKRKAREAIKKARGSS
jgi:hypothetical protein